MQEFIFSRLRCYDTIRLGHNLKIGLSASNLTDYTLSAGMTALRPHETNRNRYGNDLGFTSMWNALSRLLVEDEYAAYATPNCGPGRLRWMLELGSLLVVKGRL